MTGQAIANPDDLERFARELQAFNRHIAERLRQLEAQFGRLSDTWRDDEHAKFATEFTQTVRVLRRFIDTSEQHIPFLQRKARRLRDYLGQR